MRSILLSIKPKWVAKILNGEKGIEVRKNEALAKAIQKLIDTQGYAPILGYCTLGSHYLAKPKESEKYLLFTKGAIKLIKEPPLNGKVPAILICRKIEEITQVWHISSFTNEKVISCYRGLKNGITNRQLEENSCLTHKELKSYLCWNKGYAIHISQLEIFDEPKELSEFHTPIGNCDKCKDNNKYCHYECVKYLTKAPQNWQFIEVEE